MFLNRSRENNDEEARRMSTIRTFVKEFIKVVIGMFGAEIIILVKDKLSSVYRRVFDNQNIVVLGEKQSGKTSLIWLLTKGQPFVVDKDGDKLNPNPTGAPSDVNGNFEFQPGNWCRVKKDVPGDAALRKFWLEALREANPAGLIYMLDGRVLDDDNTRLKEHLDALFREIQAMYDADINNLRALSILVNFSDKWCSSSAEKRRRVRIIEDCLAERIESFERMKSVKTRVSSSNLDPGQTQWEETQNALLCFGADLTV